MTEAGLIAIGAGLSQVALIVLLLLQRQNANLPRSLFGLLMFATLCFLLTPLASDWPGGWLVGAMSTLVPGAFWLFSASLFDDHFEMQWWQPTLVVLSVVLPVCWTLAGASPGGWEQWLLVDVPQLLEFVFLSMALFVIFRNWKDDLLITRRFLRIWFCGIAGIFILVLILAREVLFADAPWLYSTQYIATAIVLTGTNFILLRFVPGLLDPIQRIPNAPDQVKSGKENKLEDQLKPVLRLVQEEGIHREYGMTIGKLAAASEIPEYRLRQMINSGLGFRNFNDFLNNFRIQEASRRLVTSEEFKIPVLTIALDVGFRSISSFNKVFKEVHGMTPTAYRKQHGPVDTA